MIDLSLPFTRRIKLYDLSRGIPRYEIFADSLRVLDPRIARYAFAMSKFLYIPTTLLYDES